MTEQHRDLIGILLSFSVIALSVFIIHRFIPSLLWAGIITIATHPLYKKWHLFCRKKDLLATCTFTVFVSTVLIIPLSWFITVFVKESQIVINYLLLINANGAKVPEILTELPWVGDELTASWNQHFSHPGGLKTLLSSLHLSLTPISYYAKEIGVSLARRSVQFGFTILCLFFFYRDCERLTAQLNSVGNACLGKRWAGFAHKLPRTLQATVNGTILVGMGVGLIMGLFYSLTGFPAPALAGFLTAVAAMIPFAVPIVFLIVAFVVWFSGSLLNAVAILVIGTVVMFIADHFVKPVLIGGTTKLHFLAVLFGILGGVETLGVMGLFIGPMIMVLFTTLWYEAQKVQN